MPRKQRFKPSRKPQPAAPPVIAAPQGTDAEESRREPRDVERDSPAREHARDSDQERS